MPKKAFWSHVAVIMIIYIVTFNLHPAAVVGQPVSGVFQKIEPVAPVQQPEITPRQEYETYPTDTTEEEYWDSLELLAICVEAEAGNQSL